MASQPDDQLGLLHDSGRDLDELPYEELGIEVNPEISTKAPLLSSLAVLFLLFMSEAARGMLMPSQVPNISLARQNTS